MQRNWTCGSPNVSVLGGELIRYNEMNTLSIHYSIRHEKIEPNSTLACLQFLIDTYCPPQKKFSSSKGRKLWRENHETSYNFISVLSFVLIMFCECFLLISLVPTHSVNPIGLYLTVNWPYSRLSSDDCGSLSLSLGFKILDIGEYWMGILEHTGVLSLRFIFGKAL